jgi:protein gp37
MPLWSDAIWDPFSAEVHDSHTGIKPEHRCQPRLWSLVLSTKLRRRPRILCSAADDLFDKNVPEQIRTRLWNLIDETPELD